ncbi:MAG: hypothetical protein RBS78_08930 [Coriobacteriia bacterium]|jgi:hypothetical protein|nr:hypothetical protein [Coriobacteriia bacterium]
MNTPMPKTLAEKAMLVRLTRGMLSTDVTDNGATALVENQTGVRRAGKYRKKLLADSAKFAAVREAYNALYTYHQQHTLPWTDAGPRLLPASMYFDYTQEIRQLRAACDNALLLLRQSWVQEIDNDRHRLGPMFNADDYPADPADKFYHEVQFMPVPSAGDFRVQIDPEDVASLENAISEAERGVSRHIIESLLEPLTHAAQKLATPIGAQGSVFRDTLIENIAEAVERLPKLDISGDPRIAEAIAETRQLVEKYYGKEDLLRQQPEVRAQAAIDAKARVADIMNNLGGLL